jgi:hypothetical protein
MPSPRPTSPPTSALTCCSVCPSGVCTSFRPAPSARTSSGWAKTSSGCGPTLAGMPPPSLPTCGLSWTWPPTTRRANLELLAVPLGHPSLAEAMDAAIDNANTKAAGVGLTETDLERLGDEFDWEIIRRAVLLILYLCTDDAYVVNPDRPDARPRRAMQTRTIEALWEVGYRIGTALRAARAGSAERHAGSHASPAPHLPRAHYLVHAPAVSHG